MGSGRSMCRQLHPAKIPYRAPSHMCFFAAEGGDRGAAAMTNQAKFTKMTERVDPICRANAQCVRSDECNKFIQCGIRHDSRRGDWIKEIA